jgi:hypothetical protein
MFQSGPAEYKSDLKKIGEFTQPVSLQYAAHTLSVVLFLSIYEPQGSEKLAAPAVARISGDNFFWLA